MPTAQSTTSSTNAKGKQPATKQSSAGKSSAASAASSGAVVNTTKQTLSSESGEVPQQQEQQTTVATGTTAGGGVRTPQEQPEFIKQALIIIEKKVRNLDKRRQKLEEYKESQRKGQQLNEDQQCAVNKYEEVLRSLELSKELEKQFVGLANDAMKQQKKQAKKEQIEREELIKEKIKESQKFITVLDTFGDESVRNDFLHEANGAIKLTEQELKMLDDFDSLVTQTELGAKLESSASDASEHLVGLIEAKNKPVSALPGSKITYQDLRKLFDRIMSCAYWTQEPTPAATQQPEQPAAIPAESTVVESNEQADNQATSVTAPSPTNAPTPELANNEPQPTELPTGMAVHENKIEQVTETAQQYHQQNTSDDFVIVNTNDLNEHQHSKSPNQQQMQPQQPQQQQQQPPKTFFTTLNPADLPAHRNINEFINKCENSDDGINFLQDSQIQQRHQQQQQEQHHQQQQQHHQQQHHHNQQQHIDEMNYQPNNQPNSNNFYNSNQDPNHNDFQKDNSFKQQQRGPRPDGGNRDQNGGNRPYQPRQQRPYPDDRRSGGPPRNGGGAPMRSMGANNGGNVNQSQPSSYRNGERGGEQQQRGGDRSGYRGGPSGGPAGGQRGGYGYRGPNPNPAGPRQPGNNGQRYQQQAPRANQDLHQHQEAQMA